jgi:hypothetical protein
MADFKFEFATPASHADWAKYAGFNRTTGAFAPPVQTPSLPGVKPPQNFSQMWDQETQPIAQAWDSAKQFGTQVMGGNFGSAFNSAINPNEPPSTAPTAPMAPITNPYNYKSQLDDEKLSQGLGDLDFINFMSAMA